MDRDRKIFKDSGIIERDFDISLYIPLMLVNNFLKKKKCYMKN